jgi:hypothetical protein
MPNYEKESRPALDEFHNLRWIDVGSEEDFDAIFTQLASANGSLSDPDKHVLRWFAANRDVEKLTPEKIPHITAASRACVPVIIDAANRRLIWTDLELKTAKQINNAARNSVGLSQIGRAIVEMKKPTLFDLFEMQAEARGKLGGTPEEADTVFGLHEGTVTAFDTDVVRSEFLA